MKRSVCALLAAVPLFLAGAVNPFQFGPRAEIMIPDEAKDWECAIADSTDLSKLPENLQWQPGNKGFPKGKGLMSSMRGGRSKHVLFNKNQELIQKTNLTKWNRRTVDVPKDYLKNHSAFFTIATARLKFGLFINGKYVGSSYQACLPKEMEVTKYLRPGKNEIVFAITTHEGMIDLKTQEWYAPHYSYGDGARFEGPIKLEFRPTCYVDDVFVKTFVGKKEIEFEITLKNTENRAVEVSPQIRVSPEQDLRRPRMIIQLDPVKVPANGEKIVTVRKPWEGPLLLWDPAGAHFYEADVVLDRDGKTLDSYRQKFGFREVSVAGRDILLNGKRIFLSRDSIMGCSADFEKWGYGRWYKGKNAVNATRMHLGSLPYWLIEIQDRAGKFLIPELAYSFFNENNRFKKEGVEEYCKGIAKFYRNHPSVIMYSLTNETVWDDTDKKWKEVTEHYLRTMKKHVPNALFQADADNTWNGILDINNIHYPENTAGTLQTKYPNSGFNFPNDLWWVTKEKGSVNGGWRTKPFDWSKPVIIGEFYCFASPANTGDQLYDSFHWAEESPFGSTPVSYYNPLAKNAAEESLRMMCNYYRYVGFAGLNPWVRDYNYVLEHTVIAPLDFQPNQTAGGKLERHIVFFNDGGAPVNQITWFLEPQDRTWKKQGKWKVNVPQGEKWDGMISATLPQSDTPYSAKLIAKAWFGTNEQARMEQTIFVLPEKYDLSSFADKIGVIGNTFDSHLASLNLQGVKKITNAIPSGLKVVIIAPDAFRLSMKSMLDDFFKAGGTVLMMPQKDWVPYRSDLPERDINHAATQSWIRSANHPVLAGLLPEQMKFWGKENILSTATFRKPYEGSFRNILECGGRDGMAWTPLTEINLENGSCILNSFPGNNSDPILLKLYANMIRYGLERKPEKKEPLTVLAGNNPGILPFLKTVFADVKLGLDDSSGIVMVDSSAKISLPEIKKILVRGGTVWFHNAVPDTMKQLGDLVPKTLRMEKRPKEILGGIPVGNSPLMNGIANFDLAWYRPPSNPESWSRPGSYWVNSVQTAEPPVWCFTADENETHAKLLMAPGFLAEIPSGKGRILLDTLPWENAVNKEREKVIRTVSMLCRNLGVQFRPVVKPKYTYQRIDLAKFANMGYWDRVAGDGQGGWTDQGRNDMRTFLINHVGRNDYEEDGQVTPVPDFPEEIIFRGIPFRLTAPNKNNGKGVLSFGSVMAQKLMREVKGIPVGTKADLLHVLHASAWLTDKHGTPIAEYVLNYEDGSQVKIPIRSQADICDWWSPLAAENCQIAWAGKNKMGMVNLYLSTFKNPNPEKAIRSLDIRGGLTSAQYVVNGVTFAKKQEEMGELFPVLKSKMDFSKKEFFPDIPGCYYAPQMKFVPVEDGVDFAANAGCTIVFPQKKNPMKDFQKNPFEIVLEVTPLKAAIGGHARLFDMIGFGFQFLPSGDVQILDLKTKKPLELNQKVRLRFRYDGNRIRLYVNDELNSVRDSAKYNFMNQNFSHLRFCNVDMRYHKVEFYELKENKK